MTNARLGERWGEAGLPPAGSWSRGLQSRVGSPRGVQANAPWVAEEAVQPQSLPQPEDPAPPDPPPVSTTLAGIRPGSWEAGSAVWTFCRTRSPAPSEAPPPGRCRLVAVATPWEPHARGLALPGNAAAIATAGRVQPCIRSRRQAEAESRLRSPEPDPEVPPNRGGLCGLQLHRGGFQSQPERPYGMD